MRFGLTARGWCLVAAAVGFGFGAYWSRQAVLLVPAALAAAAVVAGCVVVLAARAPERAQWLVPLVITEGTRAELPFAVRPAPRVARWRARVSWSPVPTDWAIVDASGGADARGAGRAEAGGRLVVDGLPRAVHRIERLVVELRDPLGAARTRRRVCEAEPLFVGPRLVPLAAQTVLGHGADALVRTVGAGELVDQLVRDYRSGDPMRRIHWRQSARQQRLMVRHEQPPATPRVTVVVDTFDAAHAAGGFDELVRCFASIVATLVAHGIDVRVLETGGQQLPDDAALSSTLELVRACASLEPVPIEGVGRIEGPALVVAGEASERARALIERLETGSVVWMTAEPIAVPRGVRRMRWVYGDPAELPWSSA